MNPFPLLPLELDRVPRGLVMALQQEGVPVCPRGERPEGRFVLFDGRRRLDRPPAAWQVPIDVDPIRFGCETDPFEAMLDQRAMKCRWEVTGLALTEQIARVDRRQVRRRIVARLRERIEQAGGVWMTLAPYPFPYRSAVNFRIDYDKHDPDDFHNTLEAIRDHTGATSHNVCGEAYESQPEALRQFQGLDVGSHGYFHRVYHTEEENYNNVARGIDVLRRSGLSPSGFAAPGGRYTRALAAAIQRLGVGHSSEIRLAYDDWPFWPEGGSVLQIPVHPVSLGLFLAAVRGQGVRRAAAAQQAVRAATDYFRQVARAKYHAGEPVFFHGHPTGRLGHYPQVLRAVFDTADSFAAVWPATLTEFAAWWEARAKIRLRVESQREQFAVSVEGSTRRWPVAIEYWRGPRVARIPLAGPETRFAPEALAYENRSRRPTVQPVRIDGPHGLGYHLRRLFDGERAMPDDETRPPTWRRWAARTLRRFSGEGRENH
ncbi:MAG: hypothetical protein RBS80_22155 [Thermoguttaceae bacterium]|jgi:peptidoglycan/xylan/chitin deacetylase (PgdA/CDA1 family)|nr:hypothetical protein [Thermoguttaceae bacterium]